MIIQRKVRTPIGLLTLVASERGMRAIGFPGDTNVMKKAQGKRAAGAVEKDDAGAEKITGKILDQCERELREYFAGSRAQFTIPMDLEGTEFQKRVWKSLAKIGYGKTQSYIGQATRLGAPKSVRAVAGANGKNPLPILLPCHRVIASNGDLHGFGGGLPLKKKLLALEGVQMSGTRVG